MKTEPEWGQPGPEGGRPREKASVYGTTDALGGRDPLGQHGMKGGYPSDNDKVAENIKQIKFTIRNKESLKI